MLKALAVSYANSINVGKNSVAGLVHIGANGKLVNIDNFGLDALLAVAQKAMENNSVIKLARVSPDMQIVLDITKVYRVFDIYPTIEEAVAGFQGEEKI